MDHTTPAGCLDPETLAAYVDGRLTREFLAEADRHIDRCSACRGELSALAIVRTAPAADAGANVPDEHLGRYVVLRELGRGGMGVVVRAYDPELDRTVAVKVLHDIDDRATDRLRSEARAMARLAHPNVVAGLRRRSQMATRVHRDGAVDGDDPARLARVAAHLAEIVDDVHRGRPRARRRSRRGTRAPRLQARERACRHRRAQSRIRDFGLSRTIDDVRSEIAGTPAYMAPEVLRGEPATAASDQFSFCATVYELLYGQRPFAGDDLQSLRAAVLAGEIAPPPRTTAVPSRVWRSLAHGLEVDPAARFATLPDTRQARTRSETESGRESSA